MEDKNLRRKIDSVLDELDAHSIAFDNHIERAQMRIDSCKKMQNDFALEFHGIVKSTQDILRRFQT